MWPYIGGCSGHCGGGPLGLYLALALCGVGLPLSEDVLLIGLAPRLGGMTGASIVFHLLAAVAGVATADILTVGVGHALRVNASVLGGQAPSFIRRMLLAVQKQLVVESKRDGAKLREQLQLRLRVASMNVGDQLRRLTVDFDKKKMEQRSMIPAATEESPPAVLWKRLEASNTWVHSITCNTRTSLAAWGQTSASLTKTITSRLWLLDKNNNGNRQHQNYNNDGFLLAGIDNRLAVGQRWPLTLLYGFSTLGADDSHKLQNYKQYFLGSALAAMAVTLPVQLLLGAALQDWSRVLCYILIAAAQLCRYGPIWAAVFVAIYQTVQTEIEAVNKR